MSCDTKRDLIVYPLKPKNYVRAVISFNSMLSVSPLSI